MRFIRIALPLVAFAAIVVAVVLGVRINRDEPVEPAQESREAALPPEMTFTPVFEPCSHCHQIGKGARTSSGPVLNGVLGRKAGARDDYPYSDAMKSSGIVWNEAVLAQFLANPAGIVPGTRMRIGGFPADRIGPIIDLLKKTPKDQ